jgi:hypothetical protein
LQLQVVAVEVLLVKSEGQEVVVAEDLLAQAVLLLAWQQVLLVVLV